MKEMQRNPCTGECGWCGQRMYRVGDYCCRECREMAEAAEAGECARADIGDDCRCEKCEERRRDAAERLLEDR